MTFETSMNYIVQCCSSKDYDNAKSPSSQIVLGLVYKILILGSKSRHWNVLCITKYC